MGNGDGPSPTITIEWGGLMEIASEKALSAPANMSTARMAVSILFTVQPPFDREMTPATLRLCRYKALGAPNCGLAPRHFGFLDLRVGAD